MKWQDLRLHLLCTCDAGENVDVVYKTMVRLGKDEVLKVGELTKDTGTDSLQVGSALVVQQSEIQENVRG